MPAFVYQGVDQQGRSVSGRMMAEDEGTLELRLRATGLWLLEAQVEDLESPRSRQLARGWQLGGKASRRDLIEFCTLMGVQLNAGLPMLTALEIAAADCKNPRFQQTLMELRRLIESGEGLHDAMRRFPRAFAAHFTSLIRAGEESGTLPDTFLELKRYFEWQESIIADVRQATIYPTIVLLVVALFVLLLFSFVVPKFQQLLSAVKVPLPLSTRIVFGLSGFAKETWWIWIQGLVTLPIIVQVLRRRSRRFAIGFDRFRFKVPIFGSLNHLLVISRFAQSLGMLYRSGINILNCLKLCETLCGSPLVGESLIDVGQRVGAGETLTESVRKHSVFPLLLVRMVGMGEQTGTLDTALGNIADYYNTLIPRRIKKVFSIAEPVMIIVLVAIVGGVALAVFQPILSLMSAVSK